MTNLLQDVEGHITFTQYAVSEFWTGGLDAEGRATLTAQIETLASVPYLLEFSMAANLAAAVVDVTISVSFDGTTIGEFSHAGALFAEQDILFTGNGATSDLVFTIVDASDDGQIITDGPIPYYESVLSLQGTDHDVHAFAPGQPLVYQILNGQLVKFDVESRTYEYAEVAGSFRINAAGLNAADDLIYGHARESGTDSLGNSVRSGDIVAVDASGASFLIGWGGYSHYVGDFDDAGNLWTFPGNASYAVRHEVGSVTEDGVVPTTRFELGTSISGGGVADLAFDAQTGAFYGVTNGSNQRLVKIDISGVPAGGVAELEVTQIVATYVDGTRINDTPRMTYGAAVADANGTIYVGGNSGDHDLNGATPGAGGFYRIGTDENGDLVMHLLAAAPAVGSNDGAMDPRVEDPFQGVDSSSVVLLRQPEVSVAVAMDDAVLVTARGETVVNLLENDNVNPGGSLTVTEIEGQAAVAGLQVTLASGTTATYLGDGLMRFDGGDLVRDVAEVLRYGIVNQDGISDDAEIDVTTSPVDGTDGNDNLSGEGQRDVQGNQIGGTDGAAEVVLGYGGNDKLFTGDGDDALWGGDGHDNLRGAGGNDLLMGGAGNDLLSGGAGIDTIHGGSGNDAYWVEQSQDLLVEAVDAGTDKVRSTVDWTLGDNFENLFLEDNSAAVQGTGNALDNFLAGNELGNLLTGLDGKDRIVGQGGDDTIIGGNGGDDIDGHEGNDHLIGGNGHDKLRGGSGADTIEGGADNDVYWIDDAGDVAIELANGGRDTIKTAIDWTLGAHFENLVVQAGASQGVHGVGNGADNRLAGNDHGDTLDGMGGADSVFGRGGNDTLYGRDGADRLGGGQGDDHLYGGSGNDLLRGHAGADHLRGGAGNDRLDGGLGADVFMFAVGDGQDRLYRFKRGEDTICFEDLVFADLTLTQRGLGC